MKQDVEITKIMILNYLKGYKRKNTGSFREYDKIYATTTENIDAYLNLSNFKDKDSALTVLASGDQAFSLASLGIKNITTFDINKLTEYYALGLKKSAILAFNYQEFLNYFNTLFSPNITLEKLSDMIKYLLPYMDLEYKLYWQEIIDYNYKLQKNRDNQVNLFHILFYSTAHGISKLKNSYLANEERYNYLRSIIGNINITYDCLDVFDIPYIYEKEYDFILLSNILDYATYYLGEHWTYQDLRKELDKFKKLLKSKGVIYIAYLIGKKIKGIDTFESPLILNSRLMDNDLTQEELLLIPHIENDKVANYIEDGIILERKL